MDYIFECLALYRAHKVRTVIPMQSGGNVGGLCARTMLKFTDVQQHPLTKVKECAILSVAWFSQRIRGRWDNPTPPHR